MAYLRRSLPHLITIEQWEMALLNSTGVEDVEPMVDEMGQSLKSKGGNHYAEWELKVYVRGGDRRYLTSGVTMHGGRFHCYMRQPPKQLVHLARAVFQGAVTNVLNGWLPALPPAPPLPAPPAARPLPATIPPPPRQNAWEHYCCEAGHWHQHSSGVVLCSWHSAIGELPADVRIYEHNGRRWVDDAACGEWFWLEPVTEETGESEWF